MNPSSTENFPVSPGIYIMKGESGNILYVGKAKNLRSRIRSYFSGSNDNRHHIRFLMTRVRGIEYIVTDTEKEALILENTFIKKHRPRYNINLRDDKTYFSLRMEMREEFPRLKLIRKVVNDGASYFGPYSSAAAAREVLKQIYKLFRLRHYPMEACRRRSRPCLFHQISQCSAPCFGLISREDYKALAQGAVLFIQGKNRDLVTSLKKSMELAAKRENYEEAGRFRDLIRSIELTVEKQKVVTQGGDTDVIGYVRQENRLGISLLFIRGGCLTGHRNFSIPWEMDDEEGVSSFLTEYYNEPVFIPDEVLLPVRIEDAAPFAELLSEKKGKRVKIVTPARGTRADMVRMANRNAETAVRESREKEQSAADVLSELQQRLNLNNLPRRIECFDVSNIQGRLPVASKVSFLDGRPEKDRWRRYRIKTVAGSDDYGMMREVLSRRFRGSPMAEELPDLLVIDGGQGQLNVLDAVLAELEISGVDTAALAKSRVDGDMKSGEVTRSNERIFISGRKNPVVLRQNSAPLLLLARIRDEAHRFAITHHKKLRGKEALHSSLADIKGIGEVRRKELLRHFGSLKKIREASLEELLDVRGMDKKTAAALWGYFHGNEKSGN